MSNDYDYHCIGRNFDINFKGKNYINRNFDIKLKGKIDRSEVVLLVKDYIERFIKIEIKKAKFRCLKDLKVKTASVRITYTISDINKDIHEKYYSDNLESRANLDSFYSGVMYAQAENVIENVKINGDVTFK